MSNKLRGFSRCSKEKYLAAFLLGFGCMMLTLIPFMIAEKGYFIYYGDYNAQQIPFYNLANDAVRSHQTDWNWFTDLGSDFMSSYSFYLYGSPFFRLSTLLPRAWVTYSMPVLLALKHGVASLTAYAYIRRFVRSKNAALAGALAYTFSGFQIFNLFFNHFQDVTALFPLMLIAMEENINNRRKGVFALTVALMAVVNYYFFTGQAVFLVLYYLFRMKCPDFKTSWKKFFGLAFEAIVGTMLAAFVLLPSALAILGNYRVSERLYGLDVLSYFDRTLPLRLIQTLFMPADTPASPNLFTSDYEKWASIGAYFPLFGMVGVITFMRSHKKHWASRFTFFLAICAFIPILNSLFQAANGYYYARWFYMPLLIMAMMTARTFDEEGADVKPAVIISAIILAVLAAASFIPTKGKNDKIEFFKFASDLGYFWITIAVAAVSLAVAAYIFHLKNKGRSYEQLAVGVMAFACIGCIFTTTLYGANSTNSAREYISRTIESQPYEKVSEDNFFRADISENCDNIPMMWGIPSMRAFQSVVTTSIMDFYDSVGVHRDVASRAELSHYTLRGLLSVKYYYKQIREDCRYEELKSKYAGSSKPSLKNENGDEDTAEAIIPDELPGFEYIGEKDGFEVYENTLYIPMGFAYDSYITQKDADAKKTAQREKLMLKSLVLTNKQAEKYSDILSEYDPTAHSALTTESYKSFCREKQENSSSSFSYDSHGFKSEITLDKPQLVFFSVPYSDGWSATVNGKSVDVEKVNYGFMAVEAGSGENEIVFTYETPGLKVGTIISIAGALMLAVYIALAYIFRKNDEPRHTHYYDYVSTHKISASQEYCKSFKKK